MKKKMQGKQIWVVAILAALVAGILLGLWVGSKKVVKKQLSLEERAAVAYQYAQRHGMNTNYALFLDYSIPSGTPRLFVWDYSKNKVVARTYVMHGVGGGQHYEDSGVQQ